MSFFIWGNFYKEFERYVKKALYVSSSHHRGPVKETLEEFVYWDFGEKENAYLCSSSMGPQDIKS